MKKFALFVLIMLFLLMSACQALTQSHSPSSSAEQIPIESTNEPISKWTHASAVTRFLTETNHNGSYLPPTGTKPVPPGTPRNVDLIPIADQSLVGQTVMIILAQNQENVAFYYYYNADTNFERLAVMLYAESIPMMIIFKTNLGGATGLCQKIATEEPFDATILSMTNVDWVEGCIWAYNASAATHIDEALRINIFAEEISTVGGEFVGIVGTSQDGKTLNLMAGGNKEEISDKYMLNDYLVWFRIFERFNLLDIISDK